MFSERKVNAGDEDFICTHREAMFRASNRPGRSDDQLSQMTQNFRTWLKPLLASGDYFGFVLEEEGSPVASIGLMVIDWPPHPLHPEQASRGYVLNLFVEVEHRNQGMARKLMSLADAEFSSRGVTFAILHPTLMAKEIYKKLGWQATNELGKKIANG